MAQCAGNPARGARLYWAAKNIAEFIFIGEWGQEDNAEFENNLAIYRAALGESTFAEATEHSRSMTLEQAIEYALGTSTSL